QTVTCCCPGWPDWTAAVNPPASAVSAVMAASGPGGMNGTRIQLAPPLTARTSGVETPATVCSPKAATRSPLIAICRNTPVVPGGNASAIVVQAVPLVEVHTAGWPLCDPTDTKPCASAATAATWQEPPGATSWPAMMYPCGPAVAATLVTPARSRAIDTGAGCQVVPSAEVYTTGPGTPTASQPAGPWVTLVSAASPGSPATSDREETRAQEPPPTSPGPLRALRQIAG